MAIVWAALWASAAAPAFAVEEDDDEPKFLPGLIATYSQSGAASVRRVDDDVQFVWRGAAPDERLRHGPFTVRWSGRLFTMAPGDYRLHVFAGGGRGSLKLGGRTLVEFDASQPAWHVGPPVKLSYAHTPLEIEFQAPSNDATFKLHWSGPQFAVEPIPERHLFHDPAGSPSAAFDVGRAVVRSRRCAACHASPESAPLAAPALTHLRGNLDRRWVIERLIDDGGTMSGANGSAATATRRMPHFGLSRDDATAVAAYLFASSAESPKVRVPQAKEPPPALGDDGAPKKPKPRKEPSVRAGETSFHGLGCLACHTRGPLGASGPFAGGDLTTIADKRPPEFFVRRLADPAAIDADHRMPMFNLSELERADLAVYLMTLHAGATPAARDAAPLADAGDRRLAERGRTLVEEHRCGACHRLPEQRAKPFAFRPAPKFDASAGGGCLGRPEASRQRPGYGLHDDQRSAVADYFAIIARRGEAEPPSPLDGRQVLAERNCTACHARGHAAGMAGQAAAIAGALPTLAPLQAALLPPSLNGAGDKLDDESLAAAIGLKREPLRPWLSVRMPKFELTDAESAALRGHLVDHDRIPDLPEPAASAADETAQRLAARRLVTADGFGCTSCHKIGASEPQGITNLAAHGTDLTMIGRRIRKPWFDRWVRNPPRIVPRMEMPAIQIPVKGVLHDDVDLQLAAVWKVLNEPGFNPPPPNPVRIVRARNVPGLVERTQVLSDVFTADGRTYVSPLVIGLPNRHNVLFDLETNRLAAWWTGDTALERTKGKSWFWEPGGTMVVGAEQFGDEAELSFIGREPVEQAPFAQHQNGALLDMVEQTDRGATFTYRLNRYRGRSGPLRVRQTFEPLPVDPQSPGAGGFRRTIEIAGLEGSAALRPARLSSDDLRKLPGAPRIVARRSIDDDAEVATTFTSRTISGDGETVERWVIDYRVELPIDTFPTESPAAAPPPRVKIDVVPGFDGVQLPLPPAEMPTGLAWKRDGTLVVASLKGRVFTAADSDGDGFEDRLTPISRDLATPYGLATAEESGRPVIDVVDKTAVVRLYDDDGDGYCERSAVVADGWGHTDDYHDWAVGLPRIAGGGYYVALPCQQDDREPLKAHLRGHALRLLPRAPTVDDPRRFRLDPLCGGLRFPMGLAVDRAGALFATDNQGHYNPFNELNHLQADRRYGFINKRELQPGFAPAVESPAVELPHPWSRSVNGICFLSTPEEPRAAEAAGDRRGAWFGPFEGHLIGCEYNHRSLVRMTLERIDGTYQGAAFPFSLPPAVGAATFEGPTVCEVSPRGDLYVGNMHDSGWGGGRNVGSIVRLRPNGRWAAGLADVRARPDGFEIEFTQPMDRAAVGDPRRYRIERFRRVSTPQYGGDDVDRATVAVRRVAAAPDGRSVRLFVDRLHAGFVYEFHVADLAKSGETFFPDEAYYTMKRVPSVSATAGEKE